MVRASPGADGGGPGVTGSSICHLALASALVAGTGEPAPRGGPPEATIQDLEVRGGIHDLRVSFRLEGAFTQEALDRLHSGMAVTFSHRVELLARRAFPIVPSRVLGRTIVETTAKYDSLTRQYSLNRRTTQESPVGRDPTPVESVGATTTSETEMESWMASIRDVALPAPPPETERKLRVRVRTVLGRRYHLLIFPANDTVDAEHVLAP